MLLVHRKKLYNNHLLCIVRSYGSVYPQVLNTQTLWFPWKRAYKKVNKTAVFLQKNNDVLNNVYFVS